MIQVLPTIGSLGGVGILQAGSQEATPLVGGGCTRDLEFALLMIEIKETDWKGAQACA